MMTLICIKQHLSSIWSSIHEKVKQNRGCWKKALLIKKREQLKISFGKKTGAAAQMFSCEFCEIFENTYFEEHLQKAVSIDSLFIISKISRTNFIVLYQDSPSFELEITLDFTTWDYKFGKSKDFQSDSVSWWSDQNMNKVI